MIHMGKLNMHPNLAQFLGMTSVEAGIDYATSELLQLLYRTAIRDNKPVILVCADGSNISLLREFF